MACLIAPATVAIITTVSKKKIPAKYHVEWLLMMLWGGTAMLLVDHIINGEVVPYYPFFTAGFDKIYKEILTVGLPMTAIIFVIWYLMILVSSILLSFKTSDVK